MAMHWVRALAIWVVIIIAESVHGLLRAVFLVPMIGDLSARQAGVAIGSLLVLAIAYCFSPWLQIRTPRALIGVGLLWAALTFLFEVVLGRLVFGMPWERILSDYDVTSGGYMLFGLLVLALSPFMAKRLRALGDGAPARR